MLRTSYGFALILGLSVTANAADFTTEDPALTLEELKSLIVGNSWSGEYQGAAFKEFIDPNGELRGESTQDGKYTAHWWLRDDGLFCFDYGAEGMDPTTDGCAQILKKGDDLAYRRLDGVIETTAVLATGNAFGL